tara:strand:- start:876 stop:1397 length:522 start_codon:yes stop_codon:yes gene_type:complete
MNNKNLVLCGIVMISFLYLYKIFNTEQTYVRNVPSGVIEAMDDSSIKTDAVLASEELGNNEISSPVAIQNRAPSSCYPQKILTANELLPQSDSAAITDFDQQYPIGEGVQRGIDYLSSGYKIGVNTVGQSLRNANQQLRAEPPNPQVSVSPWLNSTIGPDLARRPLDGMSCAN